MKAKNETQTTKTTSVLVKPEFWMTIVMSVSGLLLAFGVITPEQSEGIAAYMPNLIGAILSLLTTCKFVGAQHAAKVEVFRAMCAMRLEAMGAAKRDPDKVVAQDVSAVEGDVAQMARAAGL